MAKSVKFRTSFLPAQLYKSPTVWFVYFSCPDPETGKLKRKKIKLNRIKSIPERNRYAKHLIEEINEKLYTGWNPWLEDRCSQGLTPIVQVIKKFIREKEKELRDASMRSYHSYARIFETYLKDHSMIDLLSVNFNQKNAIDFMRWIYEEKDVGSKTYNNYRTFFRNFWNWMIEREYAEVNVFKTISKKRENEKERVIIESIQTRQKIREWFKENDYEMYIISILVYNCLIRPKEITLLKPGHFNFGNQTITIPSTAAKVGVARITTIPDAILGDLYSWIINLNCPENQYLLSKSRKKGLTAVDPKTLSKRWARMRNKLGLSQTYKLYSLRDTGIVMLLRSGVSPDEVMKQAGHHNLETTTIYVKHYNNNGSDIIKEKGEVF